MPVSESSSANTYFVSPYPARHQHQYANEELIDNSSRWNRPGFRNQRIDLQRSAKK